jgi:hypothetical protein
MSIGRNSLTVAILYDTINEQDILAHLHLEFFLNGMNQN